MCDSKNLIQPQPPSPSQLTKYWQNFRQPKVKVFLPKFRQESEFELVPLMKKLGVIDVFDWQRSDFGPLTTTKDLYVSNIIHKAVVIVDETGTEAAAATAVAVQRYNSVSAEPPEEKVVF